MSAPEGSAAAPPPAHPHAVNILLRKPLTVPRAARIIASVTVAVTILAAALIQFTDRKSFPNIGDSLWWAIQTVTTVGYGDLVPTSAAGRLVAALVMLVGIGFLTVITAAITSTFIETARRRIEGTTTEAISTKLDQIGARLETIEAGLKTAGGTSAMTAMSLFCGRAVRPVLRPIREPGTSQRVGDQNQGIRQCMLRRSGAHRPRSRAANRRTRRSGAPRGSSLVAARPELTGHSTTLSPPGVGGCGARCAGGYDHREPSRPASETWRSLATTTAADMAATDQTLGSDG